MFGERDVLVKQEQYQDRLREAERVRFVRQARADEEYRRRFSLVAWLKSHVRLRGKKIGTTLQGVRLRLQRHTP